MTRIASLVGLIALGLTACIFTPDSDGDGLSNKEEEELGLDPEAADSDNDGVNDGDEVEWGSDPLSAASALLAFLAARVVHQNPSHRFSGG